MKPAVGSTARVFTTWSGRRTVPSVNGALYRAQLEALLRRIDTDYIVTEYISACTPIWRRSTAVSRAPCA